MNDSLKVESEGRVISTDVIIRFFDSSDRALGPEERDTALAVQKTIKHYVRGLAQAIIDLTPPGRNQALALTALEDVQMRANRALFEMETR